MRRQNTAGELRRREGFYKYVSKLREPSEIAKRFWSHVQKSGIDECWIWTGAKYGGNYGVFNYLGKNMGAHRIAYIITFGDYDRSKDVCHRCDNPPCCNPKHLWIGTTEQNIQDSKDKGRWRYPKPRKGEKNPMSILTQDDVIEIRRLHATGEITQRAIAIRFGVCFQTINYIVNRKLWKHI